MRKSLLVLISLGALAGCGVPEDATLVIENTRVIIGDGRVITHGHVALRGNRIVSVSAEPIRTRTGVERIDGAGKTVLPGLIDAHVHLTLERLFGQPRDDASMEDFVAHRLPSRLQAFVEAGITTIMAAGEYRPFILDVRERVRSGTLAGPRIYTVGSLITAPNGHPASTVCGFLDPGGPNPWCREHLSVEVETTQEVRAAVADLAGSGVDLVKFVFEDVDGSGNSTLAPELFDDIVDAARDHGLETYAHISDTSIAVAAIDARLHRLVHLPTPTTDSSSPVQQLVERMVEDRVMASTTLTISADFARILREQGQDEMAAGMASLHEAEKQTLAAIAAADVTLLALGTDSPQLSPSEAYAQEVAFLSQAGLEPEDVIRMATRGAAEFLGLGDDLGTVEAGKLADLLVIDGDPLEDLGALRNVVLVIQSGEIVASN